jgi:hypothetical protein
LCTFRVRGTQEEFFLAPMTTQIRRADYPDYMSYLDAIYEPIGGAA